MNFQLFDTLKRHTPWALQANPHKEDHSKQKAPAAFLCLLIFLASCFSKRLHSILRRVIPRTRTGYIRRF
jgi:hypothetical protein